MKPEDSLGYIIKTTARSMANFFNKNIKETGLDITMEQVGVLLNLLIKDGQKQQDLSNALCKDKTTTTRILDTMEKRNLVVRIPDKIDKRSRLVYLANQGKVIQTQLREVAMRSIKEATIHIDENELEICKKVLRKIQENTDIKDNTNFSC